MHKSFKLNPDYSASLSKEVLFKGVPVENNGGMVEISYLEKNIPLKTGELRKFKNIVRLERNLQVFFFNCGNTLRASYTTSIAKAGVECSKSKKIG